MKIGGVNITKRFALISAITAAVLLTVAIILSSVSFGIEAEVAEHIEARNSLLVNTPSEVEVPNTDGFILSVLSEASSAKYFAESETSPKNVPKRNHHLMLEGGAVIGTSSVPAIYDAAKNDVLSGTYSYDILSASGRELSRLIRAELLENISDNKYIDTSSDWFDASITDSLTLFGKKYLLSSTITDTFGNAYVLVYNGGLIDGEELKSAALSGDLTLEKLLAYEKSIDIDSGDSHALLASLGGTFVSAATKVEVLPLEKVKETRNALLPLVERCDGTSLFEDGSVPFAIMTLGEVKELRSKGIAAEILPLPKLTEEDGYSTYVDVGQTPLIALPKNHPDIDVVSYLTYRLAFLSEGYIAPSYYEAFDEDDGDMLEIILSNASADVTSLFGYGDIDSLAAEWLAGDGESLALEYYNRKTLYEKALSIIEKRLTNEDN